MESLVIRNSHSELHVRPRSSRTGKYFVKDERMTNIGRVFSEFAGLLAEKEDGIPSNQFTEISQRLNINHNEVTSHARTLVEFGLLKRQPIGERGPGTLDNRVSVYSLPKDDDAARDQIDKLIGLMP